jgi:hypothetical protein
MAGDGAVRAELDGQGTDDLRDTGEHEQSRCRSFQPRLEQRSPPENPPDFVDAVQYEVAQMIKRPMNWTNNWELNFVKTFGGPINEIGERMLSSFYPGVER